MGMYNNPVRGIDPDGGGPDEPPMSLPEVVVKGTRDLSTYIGHSYSYISSIKFQNPIEDGEAYLSGVIKTNISIVPGVKVVVPYIGGQAAYSTNKGGDLSTIDWTNSYINMEVVPGVVDLRITPTNGLSRLSPNKPQGDWSPQARALITVHQGVITIPVGEIPVPVGKWKVQGDIQGNTNNLSVGVRGVAETIQMGAMSAEISGGIRFKLRSPFTY